MVAGAGASSSSSAPGTHSRPRLLEEGSQLVPLLLLLPPPELFTGTSETIRTVGNFWLLDYILFKIELKTFSFGLLIMEKIRNLTPVFLASRDGRR